MDDNRTKEFGPLPIHDPTGREEVGHRAKIELANWIAEWRSRHGLWTSEYMYLLLEEVLQTQRSLVYNLRAMAEMSRRSETQKAEDAKGDPAPPPAGG